MALPTTNTPGQAPDPKTGTPATQNPPAASTGQQDWQSQVAEAFKQAEESNRRFNGLMSTYQKERAAWQDDSAKLLDSQKQIEELMGKTSAYEAEKAQYQEQLDELQTELEVRNAAQARFDYIAQKHPDLLRFEMQGLLPDGAAGDELEKTLTLFKQEMGGVVKGAIQSVGTAGAPPPPPAQPAKGPEQLMKEYQDNWAAGRIKEANDALDEYFKLQHK